MPDEKIKQVCAFGAFGGYSIRERVFSIYLALDAELGIKVYIN